MNERTATTSSRVRPMVTSALAGAVIAFIIGILCMHYLAKKDWGPAAAYGAGFALIAFVVSMLLQRMITGSRRRA